MQWLSDLLDKIANWLQQYLLYVPKWIWQHFLEGIQSLISAIPVPDAFAQFTSSLGGFPASVIWFLDIMQFKFGVTVIIAAMAARFLMKFIPTLGF
jgi:hypothetical protein